MCDFKSGMGSGREKVGESDKGGLGRCENNRGKGRREENSLLEHEMQNKFLKWR